MIVIIKTQNIKDHIFVPFFLFIRRKYAVEKYKFLLQTKNSIPFHPEMVSCIFCTKLEGLGGGGLKKSLKSIYPRISKRKVQNIQYKSQAWRYASQIGHSIFFIFCLVFNQKFNSVVIVLVLYYPQSISNLHVSSTRIYQFINNNFFLISTIFSF